MAQKHKGRKGVTNSYVWHSIKPQMISWERRVFVTFGGGLEHAGGWNRSFAPKCCLSSFQCFSRFSWRSLLIEKMCISVHYVQTRIVKANCHYHCPFYNWTPVQSGQFRSICGTYGISSSSHFLNKLNTAIMLHWLMVKTQKDLYFLYISYKSHVLPFPKAYESFFCLFSKLAGSYLILLL